MSKNHRHSDQKIPRAFTTPAQSKMPKATATPREDCIPEFRADQMDMIGTWGWQNFDPMHMQALLHKLFDSQKLTWQQLYQRGSHLIKVRDIISNARKRLINLQKDDLDELYSLRLTGTKRIWGIKENNILWLLWWDPKHEICPSILKHT
ncbi:MAG TPA: hypothetical protein VLG76_01030 [Rhabdochlamydiaceae bacterium]|nr:hypothetical protein [Rhabdochlamydiaceae bacterium]